MRPPLADRSLVRHLAIAFQVTEEEKQEIQEAARRAGMSTSSYCRMNLLQQARENN